MSQSNKIVTVKVRLTGTCSNGHLNFDNQTHRVPTDALGFVTADATCGSCGKPVALTGLLPVSPR